MCLCPFSKCPVGQSARMPADTRSLRRFPMAERGVQSPTGRRIPEPRMHDQTQRPARYAARAALLACWCWVLMLWLAAANPAFANDAPGYEVAPAPAWVLPSTPGEATEAHLKQSSEGVSYLLVDNQVLAQRNERMRYYRYVSRALNAKGVESVGNLSID